jgi:hypothetical protein
VDFELRVHQNTAREGLRVDLSWRRADPSDVRSGSRAPGSAAVSPPYGECGASLSGRSVPEPELTAPDSAPRIHDTRPGASGRGPAVHWGQGPALLRDMDAAAAARYQHMYAAARLPDGEGNLQLDTKRFAHLLGRVGLDPVIEQELYNLALQADMHGRTCLFQDDIIAALKKAS